MLIGREKEQYILRQALQADRSRFVAVATTRPSSLHLPSLLKMLYKGAVAPTLPLKYNKNAWMAWSILLCRYDPGCCF